jgi:hypothetical protein
MNQVDHSFFQERLSAFADRELPADESALLEKHLLGCAECRRRLDEILKLSELADRESLLGESDYWEKAAQKIEAALEPQRTEVTGLVRERSRRRYGLWWKVPAIAASLLFLTYIGLHEGDILKEETSVPSRPVPSIQKPQPDSTTALARPPAPPGTAIEHVEERLGNEAGYEVEPPVSEQETSPRKSEQAEPSTVRERMVPPSAASEEKAEPSPPPAEIGEVAMPAPIGSFAQERPKVAEEKTTSPAVTWDSSATFSVEADKVQASDENYKARRGKGDQAVSTDSISLRNEIIMADHEIVADSALQRAAELGHWRARRDSLLRVAADLVRADSVGPRLKPLGVAPSFDAGAATKPLALTDQKAGKKQAKDQAEAALVEAWFRVCWLSRDSVEIRRGVEYLRTVATDQQSANRSKAEEYMKLINLQ